MQETTDKGKLALVLALPVTNFLDIDGDEAKRDKAKPATTQRENVYTMGIQKANEMARSYHKIYIWSNYCMLASSRYITSFALHFHVQNVVTSLVSDRNVWEAMMKNEEVTQFYKIGDERSGMNESVDFFGSSFDGFASLVQTVNVKVLEMVRKLPEFLQNILIVAEGGLSRILGFNNLSSTGPALMALTIASIMVVMVKRA
ncbi:hypothetical protein GIB67_039146 [Kingdonia uniflora]|uniref:Uncharacterized protein n=1 Tax=Kingdonia uniflora TaxID=39325 RepID=A0A7J7MLL4_9MAGN|nr:hypothetical protein GIB67_039146 [Kingdonia uniflora]